MATHSSIPARRIPWTEEPGVLQSMGLQRVRSTEWLTHSFSSSTTWLILICLHYVNKDLAEACKLFGALRKQKVVSKTIIHQIYGECKLQETPQMLFQWFPNESSQICPLWGLTLCQFTSKPSLTLRLWPSKFTLKGFFLLWKWGWYGVFNDPV